MSLRADAVLAVLFVSILPSLAPGEENVYKKGLKSTVWIVQPMSREGRMVNYRTGSGALIDVQKRLVLTNYHVIGDKKEATVCFPAFDSKNNLIPEREKYLELVGSGGGLPGKVLFSDSTRDLAVIQLASLPKGAVALRLAKDSPSPGDRVHSIGSPGVSGALFNYTDGSVKSVYQKTIRFAPTSEDPKGMTLNARIIETNSSTNKGDSGGPLMNDKAELVGVTQSIMGGNDAITRPVSIFVDLSEVRALLKANKITLTTQSAAAATIASSDTAAKPTTPSVTTKSKKQLEQEAAANLNGAKLFVKSNPKLAREMLQEVIDKFPMTESAMDAKKILETLK